MTKMRNGFTLIELLVVIAIIAVLAVVVVLTLNPAGLLQESRDSNRLSDMATVNSAIGISLADNPSASLGSSSVLYVSVPDPSATSTLGDQCQGLGLPSLPAGWAYQCAASGTFRKTDGTGWIPVNFGQSSFGTSLAQLPLDPVNATSSGLYYTYATDGRQFEVTSLFESQKYKSQFGLNPLVPGYPEVNAKGSSLSLSPLWSPQGLVGYWPMDEGTGSTTLDLSGNGNAGAWNGTPAGTSGYYSAGKVGSFAGTFNGSNNSVSHANISSFNFGLGDFSVALWMNPSTWGNNTVIGLIGQKTGDSANGWVIYHDQFAGNGKIDARLTQSNNFTTNSTIANNTWTFAVLTRSAGITQWYINGILDKSGANNTNISDATGTFYIGYGQPWGGSYYAGLIDDARLYSRALSAAEISALYNGEK